MRIPRLILTAFPLLLFLYSCKGGGSVEEGAPVRQFPKIKVPQMISEPEAVLDYLSDCYWNAFWDTTQIWRTDSSYIAGVRMNELRIAFVDYLDILNHQPLEKAGKYMSKCCSKAVEYESSDCGGIAFELFNDMVESCLFDPNSPLRNEDYYGPYAKVLAESPFVGEIAREKYAKQAAQCALNPTGSVATDFAFSDKNGKVRTLHSIKADYTVLFFSNPGCDACKNIIDYLRSSAKVNSMIANESMVVVNVYIDEDIESWYGYMPIYPENWYNGYDHNQQIRSDELYDVRAIPSLYLLDKDKRVLLKDCTEEVLFEKIEKL